MSRFPFLTEFSPFSHFLHDKAFHAVLQYCPLKDCPALATGTTLPRQPKNWLRHHPARSPRSSVRPKSAARRTARKGTVHMASARRASSFGHLLTCWAVVLVCCGNLGCGGRAPTEPEAKVRLTKVLRLYQVYVEKNKKGPSNEQALRQFGQKLSPKERDEYLIGDDLDSIFNSPRDNQKYVIRYNLKLDPGGRTRAVAWEATGQGGMRFVALSNGYVEEYDDETFKEYSK
jgi:hypothetical protein